MVAVDTPILISNDGGAARTAHLVGQGLELEPFIVTALPAAEIVQDVGGGEVKRRAQAQAVPVFQGGCSDWTRLSPGLGGASSMEVNCLNLSASSLKKT